MVCLLAEGQFPDINFHIWKLLQIAAEETLISLHTHDDEWSLHSSDMIIGQFMVPRKGMREHRIFQKRIFQIFHQIKEIVAATEAFVFLDEDKKAAWSLLLC